MNKKQWYETLFENYAEKYDSENFVQGTLGECDFIESEIKSDRTLKILDVGCGTERHSIELARRGYTITGIDFSDSQLSRAREKAKKDELRIKFLKHDARDLPFTNEFDVAIMLCEGGFPLMETDEMNYEILRNVSKSLKGGGGIYFHNLKRAFSIISFG